MEPNGEAWKDEVRMKLVKVLGNKYEDSVRVLFFLDEEDRAYRDNVDRPYAPQWKFLKATLKEDKAFKKFAERLVEDTKMAEKYPEYRYRMNKVYEQMMEHCDDSVAEDKFQNFDGIVGGLTEAWSMIPSERRASILTSIRTSSISRQIVTAVDDVVSLANRCGGTIVIAGLAAVHMVYEACLSIKRWWKGEISGKRCVKDLLDTACTTVAGMAGGIGGAAVGSLVGPPGIVVGGVIGGLICANVANFMSDRLTQKLFGIPKEKALENAYNHLGVKMTASNAEVNTAFRKLCLQYHPDKGGSEETFFIHQCHMVVIKVARGDF